MKLYTINATPHRFDDDYQTMVEKSAAYKGHVSGILEKIGIDGFTIYEVNGYWQGTPEQSFKIEVATDLDYEKIVAVCAKLRDDFNQDSVMLTSPDNSVEFI